MFDFEVVYTSPTRVVTIVPSRASKPPEDWTADDIDEVASGCGARRDGLQLNTGVLPRDRGWPDDRAWDHGGWYCHHGTAPNSL